jgi:RNA polymerase sigma factor (sigma-70 family)
MKAPSPPPTPGGAPPGPLAAPPVGGGEPLAAPPVGGGEPLAALAERRGEFVDFLRRRTRSGADPEDLLQQALLLATQKAGQLREPGLAVPWFYAILRRTLADHHARWALRQNKLPLLEAELGEASPAEAATCACSLGLVEGLPPQYAEILRRVDLGDEGVAEVAASLGTTVNNVTVRLHRARKALRERLRAFCGTTSVDGCLDCACEGGARAPAGDSFEGV